MEINNFVDAIKKLEGVEAEKEKSLKTVDKILGIYSEWDGNPETLDINSFTEEEISLAIELLENHQEQGLNYELLSNDLFSIAITSQNLMLYLAVEEKPIAKEVIYI